MPKIKKALYPKIQGFFKDRRRHTLPAVTPVPSALMGLTSLFGMGRGDPHRNSHRKIINKINIKEKSI
jgi:hypothetical protein